MKRYFSLKRIAPSILITAMFSLLFTSCTNLFGGLGIEDYWQFDRFDEEDRELIKGKWVLKKMGFESWDAVDNPYVDTEDIQQISHIESLQIDFEGEHMILTFNFNQPTLIEYRVLVDDIYESVKTWETSLTITRNMLARMTWEDFMVNSESNYVGESFFIYEMEEGYCGCYDYYFSCVYGVKNVITDEKGIIKRLIMDNYPSDNHNYDYEFERE